MDIKSIYDDVEEVKLVIHSLLTQTEEGKIVWVSMNTSLPVFWQDVITWRKESV